MRTAEAERTNYASREQPGSVADDDENAPRDGSGTSQRPGFRPIGAAPGRLVATEAAEYNRRTDYDAQSNDDAQSSDDDAQSKEGGRR